MVCGVGTSNFGIKKDGRIAFCFSLIAVILVKTKDISLASCVHSP